MGLCEDGVVRANLAFYSDAYELFLVLEDWVSKQEPEKPKTKIPIIFEAFQTKLFQFFQSERNKGNLIGFDINESTGEVKSYTQNQNLSVKNKEQQMVKKFKDEFSSQQDSETPVDVTPTPNQSPQSAMSVNFLDQKSSSQLSKLSLKN